MNPQTRLLLISREGEARFVGPEASSDDLSLSAPGGSIETVVAVPGEAVVCRWLDLPAGPERTAVKAAADALRDDLASEVEDIHIVLGPIEADGRRLAVVVDASRMRGWLAEAAALGVSPSTMTPDCLLPPEPASGWVAVRRGEGYLVRGRGVAFACDADLLPLLTAGHTCELVEGPEDAAQILALGAMAAPVDLRQGAFAPTSNRPGQPRRAAVLAALLVASLAALPLVQTVRDEVAVRRAQARAAALAGPAGVETGSPVERLRQRLVRSGAAGRFPLALSALFAALETVDGAELESLTYGEDGVIQATLRHANYSDIGVLKADLAKARLDLRETGATDDAGLVLSDFVVSPAP